MPTMTTNLFLSFNKRIYQISQEERNVATCFLEKKYSILWKKKRHCNVGTKTTKDFCLFFT